MRITIKDIQNIFIKLIDGDISRDEADRWAYERFQVYDKGLLDISPISNKEIVLEALDYLYGIDLQEKPGDYLHSLEGIKETYEQNWKNVVYQYEPVEYTAKKLGDMWVLCPKCNEAWEVEKDQEPIVCPNEACATLLNNPYIQTIK